MVECKKVIIGGLAAGLVMLVLSWFILMPILGMIFPELPTEYETSGVFRPWDDPLMSYMFIHPFILCLVMAYVFQAFKPYPKKDDVMRGISYGFMFWLLVSIPGMLATLSSFAVSFDIVLTWTVEFLIEMPIAGIIIAKLAK